MKLYKIRKRPVNTNYGRCEEVKIYLFGLKRLGFVIGYNPIEEQIEKDEKQSLADLEEMAVYLEWRNKMHLPYVENTEFDLTLNTRF